MFKKFHVDIELRVKKITQGKILSTGGGVRLHDDNVMEVGRKEYPNPYRIHDITCIKLVGELDHNLILTTLRHSISTRSSILLLHAGQGSGSACPISSTLWLFLTIEYNFTF